MREGCTLVRSEELVDNWLNNSGPLNHTNSLICEYIFTKYVQTRTCKYIFTIRRMCQKKIYSQCPHIFYRINY